MYDSQDIICQMMQLLTVSDRGVLVIPADIRRHWTGNSVMLCERDGDVVLTPVPANAAASVRGAFAHLVANGPSFDQERDADRRVDE